MMKVNVDNAFNNIFQIVIFKELYDARGLLVSIVPFTKLFYGAHFFETTSMGDMWRGSPLLIHL
jgi:hypothetical protein